jgi:hypothetical protein
MYLLNTWVLANLLHPLVFVVWAQMRGENSEMHFKIIFMLATLIAISLVLSLPSLLASWIFMKLVHWLPVDGTAKYALWIALASAIPMLNILAIGMVARKGLPHPEDIELALPAALSVFFSILIRTKYFFNHLIKRKIADYHPETI